MRQPKVGTQIRREQIAQAALELVATQGLKKLSIAAVARRVGLVPSGIYRHYKSKDQMLDAVIGLIEQRLMEIADTAAEQSTDPVEQLRSMLANHIRFVREGRALPRMIFSEDVHGDHPRRKNQIRQILVVYLGRIEEIARRGQAEGRLRQELDPETVAMMFMGMIVPAAIRWHITDGQFDVTRHARRAWDMFRRAIEAETPPSDDQKK